MLSGLLEHLQLVFFRFLALFAKVVDDVFDDVLLARCRLIARKGLHFYLSIFRPAKSKLRAHSSSVACKRLPLIVRYAQASNKEDNEDDNTRRTCINEVLILELEVSN